MSLTAPVNGPSRLTTGHSVLCPSLCSFQKRPFLPSLAPSTHSLHFSVGGSQPATAKDLQWSDRQPESGSPPGQPRPSQHPRGSSSQKPEDCMFLAARTLFLTTQYCTSQSSSSQPPYASLESSLSFHSFFPFPVLLSFARGAHNSPHNPHDFSPLMELTYSPCTRSTIIRLRFAYYSSHFFTAAASFVKRLENNRPLLFVVDGH